MTEATATFFVAMVSALLPVVNLEAYLGGLETIGPRSGAVAVAMTAAVAAAGQMGGKLVYFFGGRGLVRIPQWHGKNRNPQKALRRAAMIDHWCEVLQRRRWIAPGVLVASASVGLPPLAIVSIAAGRLRVSLLLFLVAGFLGRWARFAALLAGVGWATS